MPAGLRKILLAVAALIASALATYGATMDEPGPPPAAPAPSASSTPAPPPPASSSMPAPAPTGVPPTSAPPVAQPGIPDVAGCVSPVGWTGLRSQDSEDTQFPWKRPQGQKAVVQFDSSKITGSSSALAYLNAAAAKWNASPCVDARVVKGCSGPAPCVRTDVVAKGDDGNFDANKESGGFMSGVGHITVKASLRQAPITDAQGREQCSPAYNVWIHEMGHALGLKHVTVHKDIMDPETYPDVCTISALSMGNLAWSYTTAQKYPR